MRYPKRRKTRAMDHSEKTLLAAKLAEDLRAYGVGLLRDARAIEDEGGEPSVRVDMKDGLTFRVPFDFDVAHFDTLIAVACAARVKGREEALLANVPADGAAH